MGTWESQLFEMAQETMELAEEGPSQNQTEKEDLGPPLEKKGAWGWIKGIIIFCLIVPILFNAIIIVFMFALGSWVLTLKQIVASN